MKQYGYWLAAVCLWLSAVGHAQKQPTEDYVQTARAYLQQETGKAPQPQEIIDRLDQTALRVYQNGDYYNSLTIVEQTYRFAKQELGPEHPATLHSLNALAFLYAVRDRYDEAKPLFQRALAAREKVLGAEHPHTLAVQLNYAATLVNMSQPRQALRLLQRLEPRLLELAALRLRHTRHEHVRRRFLASQSTFQDVVLTLALSHPESGFLDLAAKVMLRWKRIQGEEEAFLARLVRRRASQDAEVQQLAKQIAMLRRDLSHLANQPKPNGALVREKLNALETDEIRLAQISREFNRFLQVRGANADVVRNYLPRTGGALLELRQYQSVDFKTGEVSKPRWAALLLPAEGEMSLHDLGPLETTASLWRKLRKTGLRDIAAELYHNLFGTLDG